MLLAAQEALREEGVTQVAQHVACDRGGKDGGGERLAWGRKSSSDIT